MIPDPKASASLSFRYVEYGPAQPPRYLLERLLECGAITLASGAKSVMKSYLGHGLIAAMATGQTEYLGLRLTGRRALVIDGENGENVVRARLAALGVTEQQWRENLRYVDAAATQVEVGAQPWNDALHHEVTEFQPDLIVIDGSLSATSVSDTTETEGIKRLYASLRWVIQGHPVAVLMYHHERKRDTQMGRGSADQAAIGSVYWLNLADLGFALDLKDRQSEPMSESEDMRLRTVSELEVTKPPRMGVPVDTFCFEIESVFAPDDMIRTSVVRRVDDPQIKRLVAVLVHHDELPMASGDWAKAAGYSGSSDSEYGRLRAAAVKAGWATLALDDKGEPLRGKYLPTASARERLNGSLS